MQMYTHNTHTYRQILYHSTVTNLGSPPPGDRKCNRGCQRLGKERTGVREVLFKKYRISVSDDKTNSADDGW